MLQYGELSDRGKFCGTWTGGTRISEGWPRIMTASTASFENSAAPLPYRCLQYLIKHHELKEKIRQIQFTYPYSEQFKVNDISPDFQKDCRRLCAGGMTIGNIAKALGVSWVPVKRVLRGFEMNLPRPPDWVRKDFEKILDFGL